MTDGSTRHLDSALRGHGPGGLGATDNEANRGAVGVTADRALAERVRAADAETVQKGLQNPHGSPRR